MNTKIAFFAILALVASSAQAAVYKKVLQDDAADFQLVSAEQTQVVVGEKVIEDGFTTEGPVTHTEYMTAPGLVVTYTYSAEGAFEMIDPKLE